VCDGGGLMCQGAAGGWAGVAVWAWGGPSIRLAASREPLRCGLQAACCRLAVQVSLNGFALYGSVLCIQRRALPQSATPQRGQVHGLLRRSPTDAAMARHTHAAAAGISLHSLHSEAPRRVRAGSGSIRQRAWAAAARIRVPQHTQQAQHWSRAGPTINFTATNTETHDATLDISLHVCNHRGNQRFGANALGRAARLTISRPVVSATEAALSLFRVHRITEK
jgi:hypothetical protein